VCIGKLLFESDDQEFMTEVSNVSNYPADYVTLFRKENNSISRAQCHT